MSQRNTSISFRRLIVAGKHFLKDRFDLHEDKASEQETIEEIRRGVVFRGANLYILMFAIMIASIGLNVNSPAVIIGSTTPSSLSIRAIKTTVWIWQPSSK